MNVASNVKPLSVLPCVKAPLLLGCHKRQVDIDRRVRLPTSWAPNHAQVWLVFPHHLFPPCRIVSKSLCLLPSSKHSVSTILGAFPGLTAQSPSVKLALEALKRRGRQLSLDPGLATAIRITPSLTRFALTKRQIAWLGCRGRTLVLHGKMNIASIHSPTAWKCWRRETNRSLRKKAAAMQRKTRIRNRTSTRRTFFR